MEGLIVVDVQNDFCAGGALPVDDGDAVVESINRLAAGIPFVVATRDWHAPDHHSFRDQAGPWPVHCVRETGGAQLHPRLHTSELDAVVDKGHQPGRDGYSGFEGTELERLLRDQGVDTVHVGGLALDYCVKETALDARRLGFDVVVHLEATRAIDARPGDAERALLELREAGVEIVD